MIMARSTSDFLRHHTENGILNWDVIIARIGMSTVLIASIARVVRVGLWTGMQFPQWQGSELVLDHSDSLQSSTDL